MTTIRKVSGWLASDGTFFDLQHQCEQHDARLDLDAAALGIGIDPERLVTAIEALTEQVQRYINAHAPRPGTGDGPTGNKNRKHQASDERAKGPTSPVQPLPADGRGDLSDLGSDTRTETIS